MHPSGEEWFIEIDIEYGIRIGSLMYEVLDHLKHQG